MEKLKIIGCTTLEKCIIVGCNELATYFKKLKKNKCAICENHYLQVSLSEKRHYYERGENP